MQDDLMTPQELADHLRISLQSVYQRRHDGGDLPPAIKLGKKLRYRRADVQAWLDSKAAV